MEGLIFQGVGERVIDEIVKQSMFRREPDNEPALYVWNANSGSQLDALISDLVTKRLELLERMAIDTGKIVVFERATNTWKWFDQKYLGAKKVFHCGFKTRLEALIDAADPYQEETE